MPPDGIEGQRRRALRQRTDVAVGHEAELDQRLETIANAEHQTVLFCQVRHDRVPNAGIPKHRGNELTGAVRLVAAGKSSGQHDNLRGANAFHQRLDSLSNGLRRQVADHERFRFRPGPLKCAGRVVFAVRAGEHRNEHAGLRVMRARFQHTAPRVVRELRHRDRRAGGLRREDALQRFLPRAFRLGKIDDDSSADDIRLLHRVAESIRAGMREIRLHIRSVRQFQKDCPVIGQEQFLRLWRGVEAKTDVVAEAHLCHRRRDAARTNRRGGQDLVLRRQLRDLVQIVAKLSEIGHIELVLRARHSVNGAAYLLEFSRDDIFRRQHADSEGRQRRRHMKLHECAGHGILAADSGDIHRTLSPKRSEKRRKRLAPFFFVFAKAFEVFLQGQPCFFLAAAHRNELRHGFNNGVHRAVERAPFHEIWIEAIGHRRSGSRFSLDHRKFRRHSLLRRHLVLAAEGHQDRARADGGVETLRQSLLRADIEARKILEPCGIKVFTALLDLFRQTGKIPILVIGLDNFRLDMLTNAVRREKFSREIHDRLPAPTHDETRFLGNRRDFRRFEIFLVRRLDERGDILHREHDRHTFLGFGNRQFSAVKPFVFFWHGVEIDGKPVGQFADGDGDAARAEVVAPLNHPRNLGTTEQTLDFSLGRRITLLHFRAAFRQGINRVLLRRARCAAAAVTPCTTAHEHHHIPWLRALPHDVFFRRGGNDSADFHALRHISGMVDLRHLSRRETDLVAVGTVSGGRLPRDFLLRQFARPCILQRRARVRRAGQPHRLIDIGTPGQRVADCAAETSGRAAERLDLRRMVVCLVLEHHKPFFRLAVMVRVHDNRAGIDLLRSVKGVELSFLTHRLHTHDRDIHQGDVTFRIRAVNRLAIEKIFLISRLDGRTINAVLKSHMVDGRRERRMSAMIGPIRVDHAKLGNRRRPLLYVAEIPLAENEIVKVHRQPVRHQKRRKLRLRIIVEIRKDLDIRRLFHRHRQRRRLFQGRLPTFDFIDQIGFDSVERRVRNLADKQHKRRRADNRALLLRDELHALRRRVRALVVLPRQIFDGEFPRVREIRQFFLVYHVHRRLRKNHVAHRFVFLVAEPLDIVAANQANRAQPHKPEALDKILRELARRDVKKTLPLLDKKPTDRH